jgi:hypothetical protein
MDAGLVVLGQFIQATRDAGYRGTASAIAELVDNAYEASAQRVTIAIAREEVSLVVSVLDDGAGMTPETMFVALQFGGSTRFNSRTGVGRYGMGLPNSSVSQARRVDLYSWQGASSFWTYLDVDEVMAGTQSCIPAPEQREPTVSRGKCGTLVTWTKCDRLDHEDPDVLAEQLRERLGRIFRHRLWEGRSLHVNGIAVASIDPLYLHDGSAQQVGPPLDFEIRSGARSSVIRVVFSALPVRLWESLPNAEKRRRGIAKQAGISIVRAGREIDTGWHFMGAKRRENYDDWWRAEVQFAPELDELFGVTHTKQGIRPTAALVEMLTPDMETIAHRLNAEIRTTFADLRATQAQPMSSGVATRKAFCLEPPRRSNGNGISYAIRHAVLEELSFFVPRVSAEEIVVLLNEEHPFWHRLYHDLATSTSAEARLFRQHLELILFAAARAEGTVGIRERKTAQKLRETWSNALAAFLA